jgi:hypothetical protein
VERPGVRLVVIDPIGSYLANVDSHKNAEVRRVLDPLAALAGRHGIAVVCVIHLNKKTDSPAMYRASGSVGFSAAARAVWSVKRDPEDRDRRLLVCVKNNLAEHAPGLAYRIVAGSVPKVGRVEWEPGSLPVENDDPSPISPTSNEAKKEREDAKAWLQEVLTEETIQTKDLQRMARESGYSWATVRRAARDLKVESKRQGFGRGSTCYWVLPGQKWPPETTIDAQNTIGAHAGHVSIYGNSEHLCEERPAPEGPQVGNARLSNDPNAP